MAKILRYVLSLVKTVVLGVSIEGDAIVVRVRPHRREQLRCPVCGRRCECHDHEQIWLFSGREARNVRCKRTFRTLHSAGAGGAHHGPRAVRHCDVGEKALPGKCGTGHAESRA